MSGRGYGLTFDDGPHGEGTPAVLEKLAAPDVRATFFLVGEQVGRNPRLAARSPPPGIEIGLHCDRHRNQLRLAPRQVRADIARAQDSDRGGPPAERSACTGLPYGVLNATALRQARSHGWRTLLWSQWGRDWEARATPESIAARVTDGADEGAVLLLHDADEYSAPDSWRRAPRRRCRGSCMRWPSAVFNRWRPDGALLLVACCLFRLERARCDRSVTGM